ncbi:hypothetical protein [Rhodovulum strictum]|nr:hypothetical protein [Rhodovulum strictum]
MKAFLFAAAMAVVMAVTAHYVLDQGFQQTAQDSFSTEGVRLSN